VYAPPNATTEYYTELNNYLATITSLPNPVFIFENFNITTLTGSYPISNNFFEFVFQSILEQVVDLPTHKFGNSLDLILTDSVESITDLIVHAYSCISVHFI